MLHMCNTCNHIIRAYELLIKRYKLKFLKIFLNYNIYVSLVIRIYFRIIPPIKFDSAKNSFSY